ncbi:Uncharacterized protein YrbA [secondary endosymbiont of Trabutina mannipara]|uniref:Uncharacterized protein YrbA n=1 Tax=secondary endosymbiont of Trabutina mannipara TaxID=1835721 RepID=A0A1C3L462_9ENTR|nr:Uncharacterized protein YrbA [secondary endosymbiont of Trabutina mannipara]
MEISEIKKLLMKNFSWYEVYVNVTGRYFYIIAVSELFAGMSKVKKQQTIYTPLMESILDNSIHALSIKVYTPKEWHDRKFKVNLKKLNFYDLQNISDIVMSNLCVAIFGAKLSGI